MTALKGTKTHENLKEAFAGESQANRRYLWFAQKADIEGYPDAAALFRSVAEGETDTPMVTWIILPRLEIQRVASQLAKQKPTSRHQLLARPMSTRRCTQVFLRLLAKKVLLKSQIGLRHWPVQKKAMLAVLLRDSLPSKSLACHYATEIRTEMGGCCTTAATQFPVELFINPRKLSRDDYL